MANHQNIHENRIQNVDKTNVVVVMVPLPAQGHLNQLLHLSRVISSHGISVHYVGAATHCKQAKLRVNGWDPSSNSNIHFHDFAIPAFDNPPPNPHAPTKYPSQLIPSFNATLQLREPVCALVRELSFVARKVIVIHDYIMFWVVQDVPSIPNSESYCFNSVSAFSIYAINRAAAGMPVLLDGVPIDDLPSYESIFPPEIAEFIRVQKEAIRCNAGNLYNSCRVIEGKYLKLLAEENATQTEFQWAVGPFNPVEIENIDPEKHHKCLEWLDQQPPKSVILVSFGTTTSFTDEEIEEIAMGLEKSGQKFIWVLREADRGDNFAGDDQFGRAQLPKGYEERVKERGYIVRDWAPQLQILSHPSAGGFMSHCGWNSCMESITMGVPIAAWPMHSDQPFNAILIARDLQVGFVVRDWKDRDEIVRSATVEEAVKRLMGSAEGDEMRQRAKELSDSVKRSAMGFGDATGSELFSFISLMKRNIA